MASLTIRNLETLLKEQLRIQAAHHGCSMEKEARKILRAALMGKRQSSKGGIELPNVAQDSLREPPEIAL